MSYKRKAAGGNGGLYQIAPVCAGVSTSNYTTTASLRQAKQAFYRLLSRAMMRVALILVDAGDDLAGAALRVACEV